MWSAFGADFAGAIKMFARFVPAAEVHERNALGVVIFRGFRRLRRQTRNALVANANVDLSAVAKLAARTFEGAFERLLGAMKLLLLKVLKRLFVEFELHQLGGSVGIRGHEFRFRGGLQRLCFHQFLATSRGLGGAGSTMLHVNTPELSVET